jgi:hypothetical protein
MKCESPACSDEVKPVKHGGDPQKYCNEQCRLDAWAIRRAAKLLEGVSDERALEILRGKG